MFVVCGEALMDVFGQGDTPGGMALDARIGGSPFNVAMGLARLGQPVSFFGGISRGFVGERLQRALRDEGIGGDTVVPLDAPTTLSLIGLDAHGVPSYAFYGEGCADRLLPASALAQVPSTARAFHFGSYTMVVEPVAQTLRALVERERGRALIAYDPNIRLNVEPDIGRWREVLQWMAARAHLLKISEEDLALLAPGAAPATLAAQWIAQGVALVVVTRGGDGAWAWTAREHVDVPAAPSVLVDTVGAGDTFQAALLAWLAERGVLSAAALLALNAAQLRAALGFAAQAAAITCSRRGADLPRRAELPVG
ncbi:carbohydrate kinase [Piscinibacter sp. XHJ-5]|uniref:carbohydrate kinase family protein n=1 Tax=Piscinibacter sp. XHJ-5 TaxID=3037797 RepID=UPI002452B4E9|nr:carbohydrate kinase [Piscinibacter sp. XHJ-5]